MKTAILFALTLLISLAACYTSAAAQRRDYFTDDEVEMIRNNQQIDLRINVLVHCIERRFAALNVQVSDAAQTGKGKNKDKDKDNWGPVPTGTRTELLADIKNILQKAIDDIDNLSERPDSAPIPLDPKEKPKKTSDLFPKAVRSLAAAAARFEPPLKAELANTKEPHETGIIMDSIDMCDEIIASVSKLQS